MDTLDLIETAKARFKLKSDRALDRALDLKGPAVYAYRAGKADPSDETICKLAKMADVDPAQVLLELKISHASEPARSIYKEIAKKIQLAGAASIFGLAVAFTSTPSNAAVNGEGTDHNTGSHDIHYAIMAFLRHLLPTLFTPQFRPT